MRIVPAQSYVRTDNQHDNFLHYLSSLVTDPTVAGPVRPGEVVGPVDDVQAGEQGWEYDPRGEGPV